MLMPNTGRICRARKALERRANRLADLHAEVHDRLTEVSRDAFLLNMAELFVEHPSLVALTISLESAGDLGWYLGDAAGSAIVSDDDARGAELAEMLSEEWRDHLAAAGVDVLAAAFPDERRVRITRAHALRVATVVAKRHRVVPDQTARKRARRDHCAALRTGASAPPLEVQVAGPRAR
jgi:hypothetical protein